MKQHRNNKVRQQLASAVTASPGLTQREYAKILGISGGLLHHIVMEALPPGVERRKAPGWVTYHPITGTAPSAAPSSLPFQSKPDREISDFLTDLRAAAPRGLQEAPARVLLGWCLGMLYGGARV